MLLKRIFLFLVDELELLSPDRFKNLLQPEDLTSVDQKKFFEDYLKNQSDYNNSKTILGKLSKLNTVFYLLCEWKRNKIDTTKIFLQSQVNQENIMKLCEIMSKLKNEDLKELIKANNDVIGNFYSY